LNDHLPYTLENLQLMTWKENNEKQKEKYKYGAGMKTITPVNKLSLDGVFIGRYHSQAHAARETGVSQGNIHSCCNNVRNKTGGFKWEYTKRDEAV